MFPDTHADIIAYGNRMHRKTKTTLNRKTWDPVCAQFEDDGLLHRLRWALVRLILLQMPFVLSVLCVFINATVSYIIHFITKNIHQVNNEHHYQLNPFPYSRDVKYINLPLQYTQCHFDKIQPVERLLLEIVLNLINQNRHTDWLPINW